MITMMMTIIIKIIIIIIIIIIICFPNADSYRDLSSKQISQNHEDEKRHQYGNREMKVEQGYLMSLVFSTTGRMAEEGKRFHNELAKLLSIRNCKDYATTISLVTH